MTQQVRQTGPQQQLSSLPLDPISPRGSGTKRRHFISAECQFKASSFQPRPIFFLSFTADIFKGSSLAASFSIRLGRCLVFKVAGVLKTWGVDEFIACDCTCFLYAQLLANETPWRSDKRQKHFQRFNLHSILDFPQRLTKLTF